MSKTTNSSHNQVIVSIVTPHVQMPGVQILRPEEIKALVEKQQKDMRSQKIEGKFIDVIKYDFIVKKEDIEAGVLGNTPENPKKNKEKRPMTANLKKNKNNKNFNEPAKITSKKYPEIFFIIRSVLTSHSALIVIFLHFLKNKFQINMRIFFIILNLV